MGKNKSLSAEIRTKICRMCTGGRSHAAVATALGVSKSAVTRCVQRYKMTSDFGDGQRSGRPKSTSLKDDDRIRAFVMKNPTKSSAEIKKALGLRISARTVRYRLQRDMKLRAKKLAAVRDSNKTNGGGLADIDIKTEAVDFDEDFDREWNDEYMETGDRGKEPVSESLHNGHHHTTSTMNGFATESTAEEDASVHSNNSGGILSPSRIKLEPQDSPEEEYGNENLRKRKPSQDAPVPNREPEAEPEEEDLSSKPKRKKLPYNYSLLQEALDLVHSQNISIMNAAKQYGIPRSSLRRYALTKWAAAAPKAKNKQEPALTPPEEAHLVSMITKMSRAGKYVSTMDVKSTVQHLLDESQRVVFKDRNRPNAGWVQRFRKRHRNLQIKGSGYTAKRQTPLTKLDIAEWCNEVSQYLMAEWEMDPKVLFSDENRHRVFNLDEMTLQMNFKSDMAEENIPRTDEDCTEITILAAVSAAGEFMQPLIVQKGEGGGHDDDIMPLDQNSYGISFSISGKMNSDIFLRWLEAFDRELCEKGVQKPIAIFLDDIFAHFHISVFTYAIDNDIVLLCIQPQTGPTITPLQPVEAELTETIRNAYRIFCKEHYKMEFTPVSIDLFPLTFLRAWETVRDEENMKERIRNSFTFMGLVPFDPEAPVYADFPSCPEINPKEAARLEKFARYKEQKAKKTVSGKYSSKVSGGSGLIPKVKIKKLDKDIASDHYKIVEPDSNASSPSKYENSIMDSIPDLDPLSKLEVKWGSPPKSKRSFSKTNSLVPQLSLERLEGRQDGIKKCIDLMESFIPTDLIPVWKNRVEDLKSSSEIPYCMWKTVQNLFTDMSLQIDKQIKSSSKQTKHYIKSRSSSSKSSKKKLKVDSYPSPDPYL